MQSRAIPIAPGSVTRFLAITALAILLASIAGQVAASFLEHPWVRIVAKFLHVDEEKNLPTSFAVLLLLFASLLLAITAVLERQSGGRWVVHWFLLATGFALMAVDEAWSFHEKLIGPGRAVLGGGKLGVFFYAWVVFGIALLLLLTPIFLRFVVNLPSLTRKRFVVAGLLFVGGAIGTELVAGLFNEFHGLHEDRYGYGVRHLQYSLIATVEEGLEYAGSIWFIRALLLHLAGTHGEIRFQLVP